MPLAPGSRLGSYEILSALGAGGMGEVYRARDTRLDRDVAIKILPETFAHDPERVARFQREAKTLAALNHPNIGGIYGVEEANGVAALVLELVEGPTLADRIAQGAIPLDEALPIARQIAEALEAAHEQGIVHRDLKPANIKLRFDGTVKVLDFGLAKAMEPISAPSADVTASPTITSPAMTGMGVILGTAAYMSPEQAKGRQADKRSDVWAFGAVLYEMLSGQRAFKGEDMSDTLAAVLRGEPDWVALPKDLPHTIGILVRRCLEKDRRRRIGDLSTATFLLDEPLAASTSSPVALAPVKASSRAAWIVAAVSLAAVAGAVGAFAAWSARPALPSSIVTRFPLMLGEGQTFSQRSGQVVAISADGSRIVYVANRRLYLRSLSDLEARPIPGTEVNPRHPVFSPDGASIVFGDVTDQKLKRIAVTGGAPVTVSAALTVPPLGVSWAGDYIFYGSQEAIRGVSRVPASGGTPELIVKVNADEYAHGPEMLPGGKHVLFTLARGDSGAARWDKAQIVLQSLETGERRTLIEGGSDARYLSTGYIIYALGGVVLAVRFDTQKLQVIGGPVPVIEGVSRAGNNLTGSAQFSISSNGSLVYVPGPLSITTATDVIGFVDRKGAVDTLKLTPGRYRDPRISPDGKQVAFGSDDEREAVVWVHDLAGMSSMRRLTFGGRNRHPVWSPDGQRIAFQSDREGDFAIFWQRADGSGPAERLTKPEQGTAHVPESWSPDGKVLLFGVSKGVEFSSQALSLVDRKTTPFGNVRASRPIDAAFSPDGNWVAYQTSSGDQRDVFVQPFPPTGAIYQITKGGRTEGGHHPFWSRDGRELYYIPDAGRLAFVTIKTSPTFSFSAPVLLSRGVPGFREGGPQNTRQNDSTSDNRVVGVFPADESSGTTTQQIRVALNWFDELKRLVPVN